MPPKHDIFDCIRSFGVKVVILGSEGAMTLPDFGRSVNSISTNGVNYAHNIIRAPPPRISDVPTALILFPIRPCAEGRSTGGSQQAGLTLFILGFVT